MKRLHIGNGAEYFEGWINIDINHTYKSDIYGNVLDMSFDNVDIIYSAHCIEHLTVPDAQKAFNLFYQWLKPNGILRLAVPSLELAAQSYANGGDLKFLYGAEFKGYYLYDTACERLNYFMKEWQHKLTYDFNQLNLMLRNAGFKNPQKKNANETAIDSFSSDRFISESLYVEAIK